MADNDYEEFNLDDYLDRIEGQYAEKPKFMAYLTAILEKIDAVHGVANDMPLLFYIKNATGNQLDIVAKYVGIDRNFPLIPIPGYPVSLTDETFRTVVLAKIMQNQWDGTNEGFLKIWENTIGDTLSMRFSDNQDMTVSVNMEGQVDPILTEIILAGYIVPKPAGVGLQVSITQESVADGQYFTGQTIFDSATIGLHYPYEPQEDQTEIKTGSALPFNNAVIEFPSYQVEQQDTDTFMHGAALSCNNALYSVTIQ